MNSLDVGLVSHTAVLNRLVELGFEVLLPWAPHLGYDLAYYAVEEHRNFGFFVHKEAHLVRIQVKTARLVVDGSCLEFATSTRLIQGRKLVLRRGYAGKAEWFGVYSPDTKGVYMVPVDGTPVGHIRLRFKSVGVGYRGKSGDKRVSYEEAMTRSKNYWWAEDYEI